MHDSVISELAQGILAHLKRRHWLKPGDRLGVAVSGGVDSGLVVAEGPVAYTGLLTGNPVPLASSGKPKANKRARTR